ncbi:MAG: DUF2946 family protein [Litorimonas sp.]
MALGQYKFLSAALVAVMFTIAQMICACMPAQDLSIEMSQLHAQSVSQMAGGMHHDVSGEEMSADSSHSMADGRMAGHEHSEHEHLASCAHCDASLISSGSVDLPTPTLVDLPQIDFALHTVAPGSAPTEIEVDPHLSGLRWRTPPRPTPVTLKTLALI